MTGHVLGVFELFGFGDTFAFVFGAPHLRFGVRLGELALKVGLALRLFFQLLAQAVDVVFEVAELAQKGGALSALLVGHPLGVLQLGGQRDLELLQLRHLRFGIFQLAQVVAVLDAQLLLGRVKVVQRPVGFVQLALVFVELLLENLGQLLGGGLRKFVPILIPIFVKNFANMLFVNSTEKKNRNK